MSKITICYIWFKNYSCYKNKGINLSSKYTFSFNEETTSLTLKSNSTYVEDLYGENVDLTAIVAQNGAGKTALLRFLLSLADYEVISEDYLVVYEVDSSFYFVYNNGHKLKNGSVDWNRTEDTGKFAKNLALSGENIKNRSFPARFIYLTEALNAGQFSETFGHSADDMGTGALLYNASVDTGKLDTNPVVKYLHDTFDWQINFFKKCKEYVEKFKINYPPYVRISFVDYYSSFEELYCDASGKADKESAKKEARRLYNNIITPCQKAGLDGFRQRLAASIFTCFFHDIKFHTPNDSGRFCFEIAGGLADRKNRSAWENLHAFFEKIIKMPDYSQKKLSVYYARKRAVSFIDFCDYIDNSFLLLDPEKNESLKRINTIFDPGCFYVPTEEIHDGDFNASIDEFHDYYKKTVILNDYLRFSWPLPSGATVLLNSFSKILYWLDNRKRTDSFADIEDKNIVFLLDEVEIALHPEWQRMYLNALLKFINENVVDKETHVQIIIATHSPIILSDVPRQNVVLLRYSEAGNTSDALGADDRTETFGENIYSLYKNTFFMENGAIGEFASETIKKIINTICRYRGDDIEGEYFNNENGTADLEKAKKYITLIGDSFVREQLYKLMMSAVKKTSSDTQKIRELKKMRELIDFELRSIESGENNND